MTTPHHDDALLGDLVWGFQELLEDRILDLCLLLYGPMEAANVPGY